MSEVFSWEYFSFLTLDDTMSYRLVMAVPALVLVLSLVWMKLVWCESEKKGEGITFDEARADALANEVDSGAEMDDSQLSEKQTPAKDDQDDKTEDEESEIIDEELEVVEKEELEKKED
eukprot:TRINITY_DN27052_c0_g1_i1.p1 TRINITY_DN27052_c0_g1~~TRINITY_DN27052_c0_g1_i1.p1  ORF type:complete len:119 (+),score=28.29 TRINITY_DN27052_c0_g1_i1:125-481(+)